MMAAPLGENAFVLTLEPFLQSQGGPRARPEVDLMSTVTFGRTELPERQAAVLRKAIRLEWWTIAAQVFAVVLLGLVLGNSQAMKVAWVEDMLSLAPPIAFLLAVRIIRKPPSPERPYGYHRSIGVAHLVAGATLLSLGAFLFVDSAIGLVTAEHPAIGGVQVFGQVVWLGWLMIAALLVAGFPPVLLGHAKMKLAEDLHDKVLYADADMNKANWTTASVRPLEFWASASAGGGPTPWRRCSSRRRSCSTA